MLLLALGLSADATAAAATRGLSVQRIRVAHVLSVMAWFGLFQAGMARAGSALGVAFGAPLAAWDHWLAFALLSGLGAKMLWEARAPTEPERRAITPLASSPCCCSRSPPASTRWRLGSPCRCSVRRSIGLVC